MKVRSVIIGFVSLLLIAHYLSYGIMVTWSDATPSYRTTILIYAPAIPNDVVEKVNATQYGFKTYVTWVEGEEPYNYLYYLMWLINATRPNATYGDIVELFNREISMDASSKWANTGLVNIPFANPSSHNYTINPLWNSSLIILPKIITLTPNSEYKWPELNITITGNISDNVVNLVVKAGDENAYRINLSATHASTYQLVSIVGSSSVADGEYPFMFYVLEATNETLKVFFPGSVSTKGWLSDAFGGVSAYGAQWYHIILGRELLRELPLSAVTWWFNVTMKSFEEQLKRAASAPVPLILAYMPHFEIAESLLSEEDKGNATQVLIDGFNSVLSTITQRYYRPMVIVFNPFSESGKGALVFYAGDSYEVPEEITASQALTLLLFSLRKTPLSTSSLLSLVGTLEGNVTYLNYTVTDLRNQLNQLNETLNSTRNELSTCNSQLAIANSKISSLNETTKRLEDLNKELLANTLTVATPSIVLSLAMGLLAIYVARRRDEGRESAR